MNVYDFDNTIYDGDSTFDFYLYSLKKHKKIILLLPSLFCAFTRYYVFKKGSKTEFKEKMYRFLKYCEIDKDVKGFWETHKHKIKSWYINQKKIDDVIISASPYFLLKPISEMLEVSVIASDVNEHSGKYSGVNCYHSEKVNRFFEKYPDGEIDNFYSDHYSDEPLAKIAKNAFIVYKNKIIKWDFNIQITPRI